MRDNMTEINCQTSCPCGSGMTINECCLKRCGVLLPPLPQTLFQNLGCYARRTRDCDARRSREHAVSRGVLSAMESFGPILVSGSLGRGRFDRHPLSSKALASNVLCKRHNEWLSPLDALATRFFRSFPHMSPVTEYRDERIHLFQGYDLERWILKTMCGAICSKYFEGPDAPSPEWQPSVEMLKVLLLAEPFIPPAGLYYRGNVGDSISVRPRVQLTLHTASRQPEGLSIVLHGFELLLALVPPSDSFRTTALYRPHGLSFDTLQGRSSLLLYWDDAHYAATVEVSLKVPESPSRG